MTMELNDLRTLITLLSFLVFAGIVFWAYSGRQKTRFDEAANLPFIDDDIDTSRRNPQKDTSGGRS